MVMRCGMNVKPTIIRPFMVKLAMILKKWGRKINRNGFNRFSKEPNNLNYINSSTDNTILTKDRMSKDKKDKYGTLDLTVLGAEHKICQKR